MESHKRQAAASQQQAYYRQEEIHFNMILVCSHYSSSMSSSVIRGCISSTNGDISFSSSSVLPLSVVVLRGCSMIICSLTGVLGSRDANWE